MADLISTLQGYLKKHGSMLGRCYAREDTSQIPLVTDEERGGSPNYPAEEGGSDLDSPWDSFTDKVSGVGADAWKYAKENPFDTALAASMFIPGVGWVANAAIRGGLGLTRAALASARYRGAGPAVVNAARNLVRPLVKTGGGTPASRYSAGRMTGILAAANLAAAGGGAAYDYLTTPPKRQDHPIMAGSKKKADAARKAAGIEAERLAGIKAAEAKRLAALEAAAGAGDPPKATKKDGDISEKNMLLMELGLGMLGDTETTGGALGSLGRAGVSALKSSTVRRVAKADNELQQATLDLKERSLEAEVQRNKLIFEASMAKAGLSTKDVGDLRIKYQKQFGDNILAEAREKFTAIRDNSGFLGFGKTDFTNEEVNAEARKMEDDRFRAFMYRNYGFTGGGIGVVGAIDDELGARSPQPGSGIGGI
jgi:hypothetical protein